MLMFVKQPERLKTGRGQFSQRDVGGGGGDGGWGVGVLLREKKVSLDPQ